MEQCRKYSGLRIAIEFTISVKIQITFCSLVSNQKFFLPEIKQKSNDLDWLVISQFPVSLLQCSTLTLVIAIYLR